MLKRCAFSGHRPLYFPWKENEADPACVRLKAALEEEIDKAVADGFSYFITGGAEGVEASADHVTVVSDGADEAADYILRDCYMVDASERMIIVYDDDSKGPSGTKDALLYARSSGVEIRQIQWMHL